MNEKDFSINDAMEFGWNSTKNNLNFFIPFVLLVLFLSVIPDMARTAFQQSSPFLSSLISLLAWICSMFLSMGAIKISLYTLAKKKPRFAFLATPISMFANYMAGVLLYTLIIMGGLLLLIVPGIILGIKYKYIPFLIIHKRMQPIEALHKSDEITRDIKMKLFLFSLVLLLLNLAGFFFFFIGIFITVPVSWLAEAHVYGQLLQQSEAL